MISADERKRVQRGLGDGSDSDGGAGGDGVSTGSVSLDMRETSFRSMPTADPNSLPPPPGSGSPTKDLMFSGLPASVIEADKLFVYKHSGTFDKDHWHQRFEYVMVFPMMGHGQTPWKEHMEGNEPSNRARDLINRMVSIGIEVYPYLSLQGDELIVLITSSYDVIRLFTDRIDFLLELDPAYCRDKLSKGNKENKIKPIKITDNPEYSPLHPFAHVYGKYDSELDEKIYLVKEGNENAFDRSVRLKVLHYMLTMPRSQGGCGIKLSSLLLKREILAFYPPHNEEDFTAILKASTGVCTWPWSMPIEQIKNYMGEKVALYYVFIGHYSKWLVFPALVGLAFELIGTSFFFLLYFDLYHEELPANLIFSPPHFCFHNFLFS